MFTEIGEQYRSNVMNYEQFNRVNGSAVNNVDVHNNYVNTCRCFCLHCSISHLLLPGRRTENTEYVLTNFHHMH